MIDPELQWRLIRAYANYHSELAEQDLDKQKWAAETGYKFAVEIDAAPSDKAENVYYYASICIRYLYFHRIKALFLGPGLLRSFEKAQGLNPDIDAAGPDRNLGVLYLELPWPLGDKEKALQHLKLRDIRSPEIRDALLCGLFQFHPSPQNVLVIGDEYKYSLRQLSAES